MLNKIISWLKEKYNECFYIGSTDKLPPPLSKEEELKCLIECKKGDMEAKNKLIEVPHPPIKTKVSINDLVIIWPLVKTNTLSGDVRILSKTLPPCIPSIQKTDSRNIIKNPPK